MDQWLLSKRLGAAAPPTRDWRPLHLSGGLGRGAKTMSSMFSSAWLGSTSKADQAGSGGWGDLKADSSLGEGPTLPVQQSILPHAPHGHGKWAQETWRSKKGRSRD